jgi:ribose transport system permease protein
MLLALFVVLSFASPAFLSTANLINILNAQAPLLILAAAGTLVIIAGGFDLSTGAMAAVANVCVAWLAVHLNSALAMTAAPLIGLVLGTVNGLVISGLRIHSFLATLASSLVYGSLALLITGGFLIPVEDPGFTTLGRGTVGIIPFAVLTTVVFVIVTGLLLNRTVFGRHVYALGGNQEAAELSGVRVNLVRIGTFAVSGVAAGIAGAVIVSRIASGQPQSGLGLTLPAIAAVILGGTSIYGGVGSVWRSLVGVLLLALIENGFNLLNANPFLRDLITGVIIVFAVALSALGGRRR